MLLIGPCVSFNYHFSEARGGFACAEQTAESVGNIFELGGHGAVVHPQRPDHADQSALAFAGVVACHDYAGIAQLLGNILRPDNDPNGVAVRRARQTHEMVGVGEVADDAVRLVGIAEFRLLQKAALAGDERRARAALAEHLNDVGGDDGGEPHRVARRALRGGDEHRRHALLGDVCESRVEERRELLDLPLLHRKRQMHELVLNGIVSEKNNDYEGVRVNVKKIEPADRRGAAAR